MVLIKQMVYVVQKDKYMILVVLINHLVEQIVLQMLIQLQKKKLNKKNQIQLKTVKNMDINKMNVMFVKMVIYQLNHYGILDVLKCKLDKVVQSSLFQLIVFNTKVFMMMIKKKLNVLNVKLVIKKQMKINQKNSINQNQKK